MLDKAFGPELTDAYMRGLMFDFDPSDCPPWYDTSISRLYEHMRHHPEPWRDGEQLLAIRRALDVDKAQLFLDRCGGRRRGARSRHQRCALPAPAFASRRHAASEPLGTRCACSRARVHHLLTRSAVSARSLRPHGQVCRGRGEHRGGAPAVCTVHAVRRRHRLQGGSQPVHARPAAAAPARRGRAGGAPGTAAAGAHVRSAARRGRGRSSGRGSGGAGSASGG